MATIIKMEVNKKEGGKYVSVGSVDVPFFSLAEFGLDAESTGVDADGLPTYAVDSVQFVQDAISAAVRADARNKLVSGSVDLKAGCTIAANVAELIAKAERNGEALKLHALFVKEFIAYLAASSGKKAAVQAVFAGLVKSRQSIVLATEAARKGLSAQLMAFAVSLDTEKGAAYGNILTTLDDLCSKEVEALDEGDF